MGPRRGSRRVIHGGIKMRSPGWIGAVGLPASAGQFQFHREQRAATT
jgi:hypothetical protein